MAGGGDKPTLFLHSSVCGTSQKYSRELICEMDTIIGVTFAATDFEKLIIKQFSSLVHMMSMVKHILAFNGVQIN